MVLVSKSLSSRQLAYNIIQLSDSVNVHAVLVGPRCNTTLIVAVYRAPQASVTAIKELSNILDHYIIKHSKINIVGDFNLPSTNWSDLNMSLGIGSRLHSLMSGHNLRQIALHPTRDVSLLDLIFVSVH